MITPIRVRQNRELVRKLVAAPPAAFGLAEDLLRRRLLAICLAVMALLRLVENRRRSGDLPLPELK